MAVEDGKKQRSTPRSRNSCTIKYSAASRSHIHSHSRMKKEQNSTSSIGIEQNRPTTKAVSLKSENNKLYFPLKDFRLQKGQMRRRSTGLITTAKYIYLDPWAKYENFHNDRNRNPLRSNTTASNNENNVFTRQNLKMTYNRESLKELNILKESNVFNKFTSLTAPGQGKIVDIEIGKGEMLKIPEEFKTDSYTELMKQLTEDLNFNSKGIRDPNNLKKFTQSSAPRIPARSSIIVPARSTRKQFHKRSVTFAPETVFFERNLESHFWSDITLRQQIRKLQKRKLAIKVRVSTASTDLNGRSRPSTVYSPDNPETIVNSNRKKKSKGFWKGFGRAMSAILGCPSHSRHKHAYNRNEGPAQL